MPVETTNWAGNYTFRAAEHVSPSSVEEIQHLVRSRPRLKALGRRHSFNSIADTTGTHISLDRLKSTTLDSDARTVTVGAGISYGELAPWLDRRGFALHNLASLPHISVAGACATATHGSGLGNACLAEAVSAIEFVDGRGNLHKLTRASHPGQFFGAVVGCGALGIVTSLSLDLLPTFQVAQTVYENLLFETLASHLPGIFASGYSVSLFTDWQGHRATQAWVKRRVPAESVEPASFFGATRQTRDLHPLPDHFAQSCTPQQGIPGPWHDRLPHFCMEFTPSSGAELQSEYFVPIADGFAAITAVESLRERITPHLFISELRTVAADEHWLSMAHQRDSLAIHFTWKPEWSAVREILPLIEARLAPFRARPHWAKLFTMPHATLRSLYPRFSEYEALRRHFDPEGRLASDFHDPPE